MRSVCVFCGSRRGKKLEYASSTRELAGILVEHNVRLIYGGGNVGLMGILADAFLELGGWVEGVIPKVLLGKEMAHRGLSRLHVVESMHQRKALMASLSDAFIALPGGIGTLEELFEIWTWEKIYYHQKPIGVLDVGDYYRPLRIFLKGMVEEGFLPGSLLSQIVWESCPQRLWEGMLTQASRKSGQKRINS
ncbi:MAG: TIGR00730 family Rossman fold protein [Planctomycetota bacterium]|nr:MAG: TIGR00730 family Rossman fold protein [Planctomycetota bacterium]